MDEPIARLRIELMHVVPTIWREVDVPLSSTLEAVSDIILVSMGWAGYHLHEFLVGDKRYGTPDPDYDTPHHKTLSEKNIRLKTLIDRGVTSFSYVYDFGDYWQHAVTVLEVRTGANHIDYPAFVAGKRRCPPEDVGGTDGYFEFLECALDPTNERHQEMINWYGKPYDINDISSDEINRILEMYASRRRGPLLSHRTGRRKTR